MFCVRKRPGGRAARQEALDQGSRYTIMGGWEEKWSWLDPDGRI